MRTVAIKDGYHLRHFVAVFDEPQCIAHNPSHQFQLTVNLQFIHCICPDERAGIALVRDHFLALGITCSDIHLTMPQTTTNEDLKRLNQPESVLGFEQGGLVG